MEAVGRCFKKSPAQTSASAYFKGLRQIYATLSGRHTLMRRQGHMECPLARSLILLNRYYITSLRGACWTCRQWPHSPKTLVAHRAYMKETLLFMEAIAGRHCISENAKDYILRRCSGCGTVCGGRTTDPTFPCHKTRRISWRTLIVGFSVIKSMSTSALSTCILCRNRKSEMKTVAWCVTVLRLQAEALALAKGFGERAKRKATKKSEAEVLLHTFRGDIDAAQSELFERRLMALRAQNESLYQRVSKVRSGEADRHGRKKLIELTWDVVGSFLPFQNQDTQMVGRLDDVVAAANVADIPSPRILDVGCGDGALLQPLRKHCPSLDYLGVDLSNDMIAAAQRRHKRLLNKASAQVRFEQRDLFDVSGTFDVTFFVSSLQFFDNLDSVLVAVDRLLQPGGRCTFAHPRGARFVREEWAANPGLVASTMPDPAELARQSRFNVSVVSNDLEDFYLVVLYKCTTELAS